MFSGYISIGYSLSLGLIFLLLFGILKWLGIPAGNLLDWVIGIASFWWLVIIVTIPWNIYFEAREVLAEASLSREKNIRVDEKKIEYVTQVSRWSILGAIALHLLSATGLYILAATGISVVGYVSSGAALLFTGLRPAIRGYQYIANRLYAIRQQIKYPREDIIELRGRFQKLEATVRGLSERLDPKKPRSLVVTQQTEWQQMREDLARLRASLDQVKAQNELEHQNLSHEAKNAIAQLTEDSQFLAQVREIIRFFKNA